MAKHKYEKETPAAFSEGDRAAIRRIEVRITKLMEAHGLDPFGKPLNKPSTNQPDKDNHVPVD